VTVIVPIDEIASASEGGVDVDLTLFGDLVLVGTLVVQTPALSRTGVLLAAAALIAAFVWTRRVAGPASSPV
jgi:hypothetical protein